MAKRYYFANATAGFTPSGFQGSWTNTASAVTKALADTPTGTAATVLVTKSTTTNPGNWAWGRWISGAVTSAGTLSGSVSWVLGVKESNASLNAFTRIHIYVTVGSSSTVRGTLLSNFTDTVEYTTTATGQTHTVSGTPTDLAISSVSVQAGDLIVVEVGYQAQTTSTSLSATMNYGNTGGFDLTHGDTLVTTDPGWIQFSDPNNVLRTVHPGLTNRCPNPSAGSGSAFGWWNTGPVSGTTGTVSGLDRTTGLNFTVSGTGTNVQCGTPKAPAASGETWAVFVETACSASRSATVYFNFQDAAENFLSPNPSSAITIGSGLITNFSTQTAPANTATVGITVEGTGFSASDVISVSCVVYDNQTISAYADGDTTGWAWDGTTETSTSYLNAVDVIITGDTPAGTRHSGPDGAGVGVSPATDTPSAARHGGPDGQLVLVDVYTDTPAGIRHTGPTGSLQVNLVVTDAPSATRSGGPDGAQGSGVTFGPDTPSAGRYGGPDGSPQVDLTVTDSPRGHRCGGPDGAAQVGLTFGPDTPSGLRSAGPDGAVFADVGGGVTLTDTPAGSRYYGPEGAIAVGVTFGPDTPSAIRVTGPDGAVTIGVTFGPDTPAATRGAGPDGVAVVLVGATDTPSGYRCYGPEGLVAIAVPISGDTPAGARYYGPAGVVEIGLGADLTITGTTPSATRGAGPDGQVLLAFLPTYAPYVSPTPLAAPTYSIWVADTVTGRMLWELPLLTQSWTSTLGQTGTAQVTCDIEKTWDSLSDQDERDPRILMREVLSGTWRFCVVIMWGNNVVWAGPYISLTQPQPNQVQLNCAEISKILTKRVLIAPGAISATDVTGDTVIGPNTTKPHAMAVLLSQATTGTGNALPITVADPAGSGTDYRTYYGYDLRKYWDAITALSAEVDGPELRLDPTITAGTDANYLTWTAQIGNPHIGRTVTPWTWDADVSATVSIDADASNQALGWWSGGSGDSRDKLISHQTDTSLLAIGYPMLEEVDTSNSSQTVQPLLDASTQADLAANKYPLVSYQVSVKADVDPMVGTYRVGEDYLLDVRDDPVIPDGTYQRRIVGLQGSEKPWVTITDGTPLPVGST